VVVFVTLIGPVVAVEGTVAFSWVDETWVTLEAAVPLNFTVELLLKPIPVIVTTVPAGPLFGLKPVIDIVTVKLDALVPVPAGVVTEILPLTAPFGTVALIWVPDVMCYPRPRHDSNSRTSEQIPRAQYVPTFRI
jgi:hypothetical protein